MIEYAKHKMEGLMANGFLCARCGWQEVDHDGRKFEEWELEEAKKVREGYELPLMAPEGIPHCGFDYVLSEEEKEYEAKLEAEKNLPNNIAGWVA